MLALDPQNADAETGLKAVGEKYVELAERAVRRGRRASALRYLDRAETVPPGLASVAEARALLTNDDGLDLSVNRSFGRTPDWSGFLAG